MAETVRVWVSKYALTRGVLEGVGEAIGNPAYLGVSIPGLTAYWTFRIGSEAFLTHAEAVADAEKRKARKIASLKRKIASLKRQIAKLEAMTFAEVSDGA